MVGLFAISPSDKGVRALAARHYSTKASAEASSWWPPAKSLCLTNEARTILFLWQWPKTQFRRDNQSGYNCVLFRNENHVLSSEVILEAESKVFEAWGLNRLYTYVDPQAIKSKNPGFCFIKAGWRRVGRSKSGKLLFVKEI